jgi:ammonia channel protein AmtB
MSVLSYIAPAAVVLALSWGIVKLTRMPAGTPAIAAVTSVAVFGLIAITPLCGFMFGCGCDWPWSGAL